MDDLWYTGAKIKINDNFESIFYTKLLEEESVLIERYGSKYDIDYIIAMMEEMKFNNLVEDDMHDEFDRVLKCYYFLRREKALEEGRKMFVPTAPSRLHSIFFNKRIEFILLEKLGW